MKILIILDNKDLAMTPNRTMCYNKNYVNEVNLKMSLYTLLSETNIGYIVSM